MSQHTRQAYNAWASTYDAMENKTRDLEQHALQQVTGKLEFGRVLELGCGTGKNTGWLAKRAREVTALDFSRAMLEVARQKTAATNVRFAEGDLLQPWPLPRAEFELVTCSLVLEHIANLEPVFAKAAQVLQPGGFVYVCELHPIRQYQGKGAHFTTETGQVAAPENHIHHLTDYTRAASASGLRLIGLQEWFDTEDRKSVPRLVSFLFRK